MTSETGDGRAMALDEVRKRALRQGEWALVRDARGVMGSLAFYQDPANASRLKADSAALRDESLRRLYYGDYQPAAAVRLREKAARGELDAAGIVEAVSGLVDPRLVNKAFLERAKSLAGKSRAEKAALSSHDQEVLAAWESYRRLLLDLAGSEGKRVAAAAEWADMLADRDPSHWTDAALTPERRRFLADAVGATPEKWRENLAFLATEQGRASDMARAFDEQVSKWRQSTASSGASLYARGAELTDPAVTLAALAAAVAELKGRDASWNPGFTVLDEAWAKGLLAQTDPRAALSAFADGLVDGQRERLFDSTFRQDQDYLEKHAGERLAAYVEANGLRGATTGSGQQVAAIAAAFALKKEKEAAWNSLDDATKQAGVLLHSARGQLAGELMRAWERKRLPEVVAGGERDPDFAAFLNDDRIKSFKRVRTDLSGAAVFDAATGGTIAAAGAVVGVAMSRVDDGVRSLTVHASDGKGTLVHAEAVEGGWKTLMAGDKTYYRSADGGVYQRSAAGALEKVAAPDGLQNVYRATRYEGVDDRGRPKVVQSSSYAISGGPSLTGGRELNRTVMRADGGMTTYDFVGHSQFVAKADGTAVSYSLHTDNSRRADNQAATILRKDKNSGEYVVEARRYLREVYDDQGKSRGAHAGRLRAQRGRRPLERSRRRRARLRRVDGQAIRRRRRRRERAGRELDVSRRPRQAGQRGSRAPPRGGDRRQGREAAADGSEQPFGDEPDGSVHRRPADLALPVSRRDAAARRARRTEPVVRRRGARRPAAHDAGLDHDLYPERGGAAREAFAQRARAVLDAPGREQERPRRPRRLRRRQDERNLRARRARRRALPGGHDRHAQPLRHLVRRGRRRPRGREELRADGVRRRDGTGLQAQGGRRHAAAARGGTLRLRRARRAHGRADRRRDRDRRGGGRSVGRREPRTAKIIGAVAGAGADIALGIITMGPAVMKLIEVAGKYGKLVKLGLDAYFAYEGVVGGVQAYKAYNSAKTDQELADAVRGLIGAAVNFGMIGYMHLKTRPKSHVGETGREIKTPAGEAPGKPPVEPSLREAANQKIPAAEKAPPAVEKAPPAVEKAPPAVEKAPPAVEKAPPAVEPPPRAEPAPTGAPRPADIPRVPSQGGSPLGGQPRSIDTGRGIANNLTQGTRMGTGGDITPGGTKASANAAPAAEGPGSRVAASPEGKPAGSAPAETAKAQPAAPAGELAGPKTAPAPAETVAKAVEAKSAAEANGGRAEAAQRISARPGEVAPPPGARAPLPEVSARPAAEAPPSLEVARARPAGETPRGPRETGRETARENGPERVIEGDGPLPETTARAAREPARTSDASLAEARPLERIGSAAEPARPVETAARESARPAERISEARPAAEPVARSEAAKVVEPAPQDASLLHGELPRAQAAPAANPSATVVAKPAASPAGLGAMAEANLFRATDFLGRGFESVAAKIYSGPKAPAPGAPPPSLTGRVVSAIARAPQKFLSNVIADVGAQLRRPPNAAVNAAEAGFRNFGERPEFGRLVETQTGSRPRRAPRSRSRSASTRKPARCASAESPARPSRFARARGPTASSNCSTSGSPRGA
ncbi:MAG: hypothetical protein M0D55_17155 [Elusimicrobiota bacterium]|nr:MAG: hypothetical protein M0D55_17155 [Elusimicrobiota bacterium]